MALLHFSARKASTAASSHDIVYRILGQPAGSFNAGTFIRFNAVIFPRKGQSRPWKLSNEKALVVEDDAGWRSILEELLGDAGFQVRTCASFGDALGYLRREKFSLAVIDLSLQGTVSGPSNQAGPDGNLEGYQLLAAARESSIPTIVVSGITETEEIERVYAEFTISSFMRNALRPRSLPPRSGRDQAKSPIPE